MASLLQAADNSHIRSGKSLVRGCAQCRCPAQDALTCRCG